MNESTDLARGAINGTDELSVQLIQPDHMPAVVRIVWPPQPTVCDPRRFPDLAATIVRLFSRAAVELTRRRASGL